MENKTLIVCSNEYKKSILARFYNEKKIMNVSFLTLEEYKKNYFFDYDYKAIKYLVDNYKLSVKNAKEIIENLYYIEDKKYSNEKLDNLLKYKKELIDNNLLIFNPLFSSYLKQRDVVVKGYGKLDKFNSSLFENIEEYENKNKSYSIVEFSDIEKEVEYVYNAIYDLLNKGVDINSIYLLNVADEYNSYIKRFNSYYDFKIEDRKSNSLYATSFAQEFLNNIKKLDRIDLYNLLIESNNDYSNKLINIINKYVDVELKDVYDFIVEDLKNTNIDNSLENVVKCKNMFTPFNDDDYVFMLGFNDLIPTVKKDNDYISDNLKPLVNMSSIEEENFILKENTRAYLSNIKNLYLSYCISTPFKAHDKQTLLSDVSYISLDNDNKHSHKLNKNKYSEKLDNLNKYGIKSADLNELYTTYNTNGFNEYDNSYKEFDTKIDNVKLSYSSMNAYYECAFKYYLDKVLKIKENDTSFMIDIGHVAHETLQKTLKGSNPNDSNPSFDKYWDQAIINNKCKFETEKDKYFMDKLKEEIKQDLDIILNQRKLSVFNDADYEKEIVIDVDDHIKFKGILDKVLKYKKNLCIVDYKTGNSQINSNLYEYGLSLQLPSYLYLLKHSSEYSDFKILGYYLQHLINDDNKYDGDKTKTEIKENSMKLDGYTNCDENLIDLLDSSLKENGVSDLIKGLKKNKKDGDFSKLALNKLVSEEDMNDLAALVETKIIEAANNILNNRFKINPKSYDGKDISCAYCTYKDVCYRRNKDYVAYKKKEEE